MTGWKPDKILGQIINHLYLHYQQVYVTGFPLYFGSEIQGLFKDFQGRVGTLM